MSKYDFHVSFETNNRTGEIMAAYLQIRRGESAKVKEYADGNLFADYDRSGKLLGIEILAPCSARVLDRIAANATSKKFVRSAVPPGLLVKS